MRPKTPGLQQSREARARYLRTRFASTAQVGTPELEVVGPVPAGTTSTPACRRRGYRNPSECRPARRVRRLLVRSTPEASFAIGALRLERRRPEPDQTSPACRGRQVR